MVSLHLLLTTYNNEVICGKRSATKASSCFIRSISLSSTILHCKMCIRDSIIGKQEITIKDGRLTPEALWAMGRIGSLSISPDGKQIAYTVAYYSVPENKSHHVIYVMDADGKNNTLLTQTAWNESEPQWIKGGTKIAFLCNESGGSQIWEMNPDGTERRIISDFKGNIEGFSFSPDGKKILFISQIKYGQRTVDLYPCRLYTSRCV